MTYRNKKYLALARGKPCASCGVTDGTVVSAHYTGKYSHRLGKGTGHKAHDFAVAHLCSKCHYSFDLYQDSHSDDMAIEFMLLIFETLNTCLETGELELKV